MKLAGARLPRWCLPTGWPVRGGQPALADLTLASGRLVALEPAPDAHPTPPADGVWALSGRPVLPGLVDAHTHLDSAFTRPRIRNLAPGLLGGIAGKASDRAHWSEADVHARASRALEWAWASGTTRLRTHVDWTSTSAPASWRALERLAAEWGSRVRLERVCLAALPLYTSREGAQALAQAVAQGADTRLGGFVHTSNFDDGAIGHLLRAAQEHDLDVDLHIDEELSPQARGVASVARWSRELGFTGRIVCSHACALSALPEAEALRTLDDVATQPITLVSLPQNNLYLQDATPERTPRARGLSLIREARARGIPVLMATDSVEDPFFPMGSFDPVDAITAGVLAGQLDQVFDSWSEAICRADWLDPTPTGGQLSLGAPADFVVFTHASAPSWPARAHPRLMLRHGQPLSPPSPLDLFSPPRPRQPAPRKEPSMTLPLYRRRAIAALGVSLCAAVPLLAQAQEKFVFMTNWYAQAEHGGYYQAITKGLYKQAGLDVAIRMGGPQVNTLQILAAGQADCVMGSSDTQVLKIREQGIPAVTIATIFQKDPQGLVAHPDAKRIEDLKGRTILISTGARNTYWPWLKATFGFAEEQARPYQFSLAPFVADKTIALQGYVTFDPHAVKSQTGIDPAFFLFSDLGWPPYANTVVCMEKSLKDNPQKFSAFLKASLEGWKSYLAGDRAEANAMIKKDNPQMSDAQLDFAVATMKERGMVTGGDAARAGIGTITPVRLKQTYDFLVGQKLLDPAKVELSKSYDLSFMNAIKVMP